MIGLIYIYINNYYNSYLIKNVFYKIYFLIENFNYPNIYILRIIINLFNALKYILFRKNCFRINLKKLIFFIKKQFGYLNINIYKILSLQNIGINNYSLFNIKNNNNYISLNYCFKLGELVIKPSFIIC